MRGLLSTAALAVVSMMTAADAKAVFAHFMVGNTENYTNSDWLEDVRIAKNVHIDAFALNMAHGDPVNEQALPAAFAAAASVGLFLFFSFDYAGNGFWPPETVIEYINKYASNSAYFHHNGRPFVSTFEGPDNATDWIDIKRQTSCFFMPSWSSLGAQKAMAAGGGVADGLFSWAAWPWGNWDMTTYSDASYRQYLGGKPYMMPISPWFYTNLPGYDKNWVWRGDGIWPDRWFQAQWLQPEFVQIISWNDYGESHYIGPVRDKAMKAFHVGKAPFNYGTMPHDAWRDILPFAIDMYKNNVSTIDFERAIAWYKPVSSPLGLSKCDRNGTVANTASQLQIEYPPDQIFDDSIYIVALVNGPPDKVECFIGESITYGLTLRSPEGNGAGMYTLQCIAGPLAGDIVVRVTRGNLVLNLKGVPITDNCSRWNGFMNYNAYVMGAVSPAHFGGVAADISHQVCVSGTGMYRAEKLCWFTCSYGYCPEGACVCTRFGKQPTLPKAKNIDGYPTAQYDESFSGLCSFACNYGDCSSFAPVCSTTKVPLTIWPESLFDPPYCTGGASSTNDYFEDLCQFTCTHGFCPIAACQCRAFGFLNLLEPTLASNATTPAGFPDYGLCKFACKRGFCPETQCYENGVWDPDGEWGPDYDPISDEYISDEDILAWTCDPTAAPQTLDDIINAIDSDSMPPDCRVQWTLSVLFNTLLSFQDQFAEAVKGYDPLYSSYEGWVKDSVDPKLSQFVNPEGGEGAKYLDCVITSAGHSTKKMDCPSAGEDLHYGYVNADWNVEFFMRDEKGFYDAAATQIGVERDWITFGDVTWPYTCVTGDGGPGGRGGKLVGPPTRLGPCTKLAHGWKNAPKAINKNDIKVVNPKTVIEASMPNTTALTDVLLVAYLNVVLHTNDAEGEDIVSAASMPVFMMQQAIDSMAGIKEIGAHIIEENKKKLITLILSIVLMVIPFVGEAGGALFGGVAMVARIAALLEVAGNAALTAYDIVDDPASAPFAILGLLVGGFGTGARSEKDAFGEAGKARKGLSRSDIANMGETFAKNDAKVQQVINACWKRS